MAKGAGFAGACLQRLGRPPTPALREALKGRRPPAPWRVPPRSGPPECPTSAMVELSRDPPAVDQQRAPPGAQPPPAAIPPQTTHQPTPPPPP